MDSAKDIVDLSVHHRSSFTFQAWKRLKNVSQALCQTEDKVKSLKAEIEQRLKSTERLREKRAELQACRISVQTLETQLEWRRTNARTASARLAKARHHAADCQIRMSNFAQEINELKASFVQRQRVYVGSREKLIWAAAQLFMRRRQMVEELRAIFYIEPVSPMAVSIGSKVANAITCACKEPLKIVNVHLPDAEEFQGHNDVDVSVGLCYVAQALITLSLIFDFSLRYPFEFFGSRSSVHDLINPELPSNQRLFPLFSRNQDKFAFQYGVFLLNKNIAQLRCDSGTMTQDLRCTLTNLRSLVDHLADAKLEPYMYVTRAMRMVDGVDDGSSFASPSVSSGARSSNSGDPTHPKPYGSTILISSNRAEENAAIQRAGSSSLDLDRGRSDDENPQRLINSDSDQTLMSQEPSGYVSSVVNKDLLRTCYFTADDDDRSYQSDQTACDLSPSNGHAR